jgi:ferredoxin
MGRIVRVWIDEQACLAHGLCEGECPEVFAVVDDHTDDTYPVAKIRPDAHEYYLTKDAEIRFAASCCPVKCIHIEESEG